MDAITLLKERRSVRKYKDQVVDRSLMKEIVDLARWAPSWANVQIARYTMIDSPETIKAIAQDGVHQFSYNMKTLAHAKGVCVLSYVKGKSGKLSTPKGEFKDSGEMIWEIFDAGIACQTFCLAAHAKGIGTCVFGVIDNNAIEKIVALPEGERVAAVIVYGYEEGEHAAPTPRMEADKILRFI
ncbi:nitroreductase family protein [Halosquirtibacter laminarini]|uniref:Nitroreductase family protein n=1 Tax=Halosquirtibacter laminarini TaxID=3374600 RepID=A0AC61NQA0_9BACT|nr:nitroreductase family protein [Prolixibacteraceae bacterium]